MWYFIYLTFILLPYSMFAFMSFHCYHGFPLLYFAGLFKSYKLLSFIFPLGTSASHYDRLACIRPTCPYKNKYKICKKCQNQLFQELNRIHLEKPEFFREKIPERRQKYWQDSDIFGLLFFPGFCWLIRVGNLVNRHKNKLTFMVVSWGHGDK